MWGDERDRLEEEGSSRRRQDDLYAQAEAAEGQGPADGQCIYVARHRHLLVNTAIKLAHRAYFALCNGAYRTASRLNGQMHCTRILKREVPRAFPDVSCELWRTALKGQ